MTKLISLEELHRRSVKARQKKASERRAKVKVLKDKGMTAPQIAAELDIKVRLVHHDFKILNQELYTEMKLAFSRGDHRLGCELEQKLLKWTRGRMPKEK